MFFLKAYQIWLPLIYTSTSVFLDNPGIDLFSNDKCFKCLIILIKSSMSFYGWLIFCFNFQPWQINHGVQSIHYVAFYPLNTLNFFGLLSGFIQSWV